MFQHLTLRRALLAACLLASFSAHAEQFDFDLPQQELAASLDALSSQGHVCLMYSPDAVKGLRAPAVSGPMTPEQAVAKLLRGTGLTWSGTEGAIVVRAGNEGGGSLDEVVVAATRTENRLGNVPASVSAVDADDFAMQQAATVADVMKKLPNVDFGGGPRADGQIPTIRGAQFHDIILLVDGARRNPGYLLSTPLFIDPFLISRAEVVRGPASTYGSGGLGGAMVFTTVSAKELLKDGKSAGGDIKAGFGSGDNSHRYNARVYGSHGALDLLLAGGYQDYNGIHQPGGATLTPNTAHGTSALFKAGVQASDSLRFELSHKAYNKDAWETNNPQVVIGQVQVAHIRQGETVLSASTLNDLGEKALDVKVYDSRTQTQRDANTTFQIPGGAALPYPYSNYVVQTDGIGVQHTSRIDSGTAGNHRLTYGLDAYQDKLSTAQGTVAAPFTPGAAAVNPDGALEVQGAFVQDEIAVGAWRIIPSVRYDGYSAKPVNTALATNSNSHVSPKLALAWQESSGLNMYGSYGQAFRAPTVWELYQNSPPPGFRRFAPNPTLQPQTDTTLEFGGHYEKHQVSGTDGTLRLHAAIFQAKVKNLIQQVTIAGVAGAFNSMLQNQNVASATKTGAELSGSYRTGSWKVDANYSRIRVVDNANSPTPNLFSPPDKLATQLSYAVPSMDVSLAWGMTAVAAQDYDSTVLRRRGGYAAHDIYASWQAPGQQVRVDFGITNLFDKRYLSYQQSQAQALTAYEMGRSYNLSVTGSF